MQHSLFLTNNEVTFKVFTKTEPGFGILMEHSQITNVFQCRGRKVCLINYQSRN